MSKRTLLSLIASAVLAASLLLTSAFAAAPAHAATFAEPTPTGDRLERALVRLQDAEEAQQRHLDRSEDVRDRTEEWIDRLDAEGKETSALRTALDAFLAGKAEAQAYHDEASAILDRHAGFDSEGNMTDLRLAQETVLDARLQLREAHLVIAKTVMEFRHAVQDYRRSLRAAGEAE